MCSDHDDKMVILTGSTNVVVSGTEIVELTIAILACPQFLLDARKLDVLSSRANFINLPYSFQNIRRYLAIAV